MSEPSFFSDAQKVVEAVLLSVTAKGDRIVVKSPYRFKDALKDIVGGRWDSGRGAWTFPVSAASARRVYSVFDGQPRINIQSCPDFKRLLEAALQAERATFHKDAEDLPQPPIRKLDSWRHQTRGFWFAHDLLKSRGGGAFLFMDMGTGKSKTAIDLIQNSEGVMRVLILAPRSVVSVWPDEFNKHAASRFKVFPLAEGSTEWRAARIEETALQYSLTPVVYVLNYEAAWREPLASTLLSMDWDYFVLDECHRIKSPGGRASMYCAKLRNRARCRLGLSGTPCPHSPLDAYGQFRAVDPGIFGESFARFRNRYAVMGGYKEHQVMGFRNEDEFNRLFYSISYRVGCEVLDLPEDLHIQKRCDLEPKAAKIYRRIDRDFFAELEGGMITAANAAVKIIRLQQVTSGLVKDENGLFQVASTAKKELFRDVLEDIPKEEPVVVFARFHQDLDAIREVTESLGRKYLELSGRVDDLAEFKAGKGGEVFAAQIQSGKEGVDLTRSCYCVYYSIGYSLGDFDQSRKRVLRPGQKRPVRYFHLIVNNSIDEIVYASISDKRDIVEYVLSLGKAAAGEGVKEGVA